MSRCFFIPPYLLDALAASHDATLARCGDRTRTIDEGVRAERRVLAPARLTTAWEVHDGHNGSTLPGPLVRSAGQPESGDAAVDEAGIGLEATLALYSDLGRSSYDGKGAGVLATVHYERDYDNAFWDGSQLVFGDGDGKVFGRFTKPIDVLGHELTHALTSATAKFDYNGQSGALNESVSDVFGSCVKQRSLDQRAAEADWLIGEGIFLPGVSGKALRSMKDPGTAYDDPAIGKDPQVGSMADYVTTTDDNGGVHINSGIPNRAFQLAATAIGGTSWEGAGRIWFAALTSGISASADFEQFADACVAAAGPHASDVRKAWGTVGVGSASSIEVVRSGGFAGQTVGGRLRLDSEDPRAAEARDLLGRLDPTALRGGQARPDRFVYEFRGPALAARVHEPDLTPELRRLVELVLG